MENLTESFLSQVSEFLSDHILSGAALVLLAAIAIVVAMAVDLYCGIQKAKKNGKATTSTGLKKTCDKARKYFTPFLCLCCIDIITCVVVPFPAFSLLWASYCVYCEFKSVREKAWEKEELRKAERTMNIIIENKDDIAQLVAKLLTDNSIPVSTAESNNHPKEE